MLNLQIAIGRAGRDPETKFLPSGVAVSNLSVATEKSWKDKNTGEWKKQTEWIDVVGFSKENAVAGIHKGDLVLIVGANQTRSYEKNGEKKYRTELLADRITNLSAMERGKQPQEGSDEPWQ